MQTRFRLPEAVEIREALSVQQVMGDDLGQVHYGQGEVGEGERMQLLGQQIQVKNALCLHGNVTQEDQGEKQPFMSSEMVCSYPFIQSFVLYGCNI